MKALYITAPGQYGLVDRPNPRPALDEALVKVASMDQMAVEGLAFLKDTFSG